MKQLIINNRLDFDAVRHPRNISIESPLSPSFIEKRKKDYATRASFEVQSYAHCTVVFLLFTYAPDMRPMMPDSDIPCFNRDHISTLIKSLKDHYTKSLGQRFSYLIGAEYGLDKSHDRAPHYHSLFVLDASIQPREFVERCRTIWTGESYGVKSESWSFGNLGFMFPSPKECDLADALRASGRVADRDYIAKDNGACATYAAKYAVKQVGFFRDGDLLPYVDTAYKRHINRKYLPKVWSNHRFGFHMLQDESINFVENEVFDKLRNKWVSIPLYVRNIALQKKVFVGFEKHHVPFSDDETEFITDKNGNDKYFRKYVRRYHLRGMQLKREMFKKTVDTLTQEAIDKLHFPPDVAKQCVLIDKLYQHVPHTALDVLERDDINPTILNDDETYLRIYTCSYLLNRWDCNLPFYFDDNSSIYDLVYGKEVSAKYALYLEFHHKKDIHQIYADWVYCVDKVKKAQAEFHVKHKDTISIDDLKLPPIPFKNKKICELMNISEAEMQKYVKKCLDYLAI